MLNSSLQELFVQNPIAAITAVLLAIVVYVVVCMLPLVGLLYGLYFLLTLPLRRSERARFFLDLLELGLKEGRTPEAAVADAASSRDPALGYRFQMLAVFLRSGMRLSQALERVPRLLPPAIQAMLKTGERIGDVAKTLPACRLMLRDGLSQVRGGLNYLLILFLVATPFTVAIPILLKIYVIPKFVLVFSDMGGGAPMPGFARFVFWGGPLFLVVPAGVFLLFWAVLAAYLGGPRLQVLLGCFLPGVIDWVQYRLPWRRKRLQRDFSSMLAVLLEAEVPEAEAVRLAAESTANRVMLKRAQTVCAQLAQGVKLVEAIRWMDDAPELGWRLTNALHQGSGFTRALAGWHEALDAKAFQLEQTAAQLATTGLVLFNGLLVAAIVASVFLVLIDLVNRVSLW